MDAETTIRVWTTDGGLSLGDAERADRVTSGIGADLGPGVVVGVGGDRPQFVEWNDGLGHYINNSFPTNLTDAVQGNVTDDVNPFFFYEKEQFAVLWILFTSIVLGNTAVLVALFFSKSRKSRMNFFIMQLALADLLVGVISVLTDIVWRMSVSWKAGNLACKIIRFLQAMVTYSSTYVLVALSIDRFDAITHPMNFSGSWRRARLLVLFAWALSALFSSPLIVLFEERLIEDQLQCWIDFSSQWQWQVYMTLVAATLFVIPAVIITACYTVIVYTIWSKSKTLSPIKRAECTKNGEIEPDIRRSSSRGIIPRAKIKTVKMTFVIVIVFILCWSPYIVFDLLQVYGYIPRTQTNIAVATFIQSLAPLNSAANPIIYCLFSTHTCRTLRRLPPLSWIPCCWKASTDSSSYTETLTSSNRQASSSLLRSNTTQIRPILRTTIVNNNNNNNNTEDSLL